MFTSKAVGNSIQFNAIIIIAFVVVIIIIITIVVVVVTVVGGVFFIVVLHKHLNYFSFIPTTVRLV